MYYYLIGSLKRRLILELQESFSHHPVYRKIVPYIQNKYSFQERPQYGIVVQGSSANKVQLAADNFMGTVQSHVMLAQLEGQNTYPLEWVREDLACVRKNNDQLPTAAGVYYMEILKAPQYPGDLGSYIIDPLLTVTNEPVFRFTTGLETEGQLQNIPLDQTLRLYLNRSVLLTAGEDYILGENGAIEFLRTFSANEVITADYRYPIDSIGPVDFQWNTADFKTLPGVVMAFGKRSEAGQKIAIVIYEDRVGTAKAFGGKHEVSFDLEVLARDPIQSEEIADLATMYLWAEKKGPLELEGIDILDVSISGESEEPIDETGQDFQYSVNMSVQFRADWEVHIPLALTISHVESSTIEPVSSEMFYTTLPIVAGRNPDFERIR